MQPLSVLRDDRILIVAPHPDDECIGAGGLLTMFPGQCDVWVLTDGRYGIRDLSADRVIEIRKEEFLREMELLKQTSYKMFGIGDGSLLQNSDCLIDEDMSRYTKIFVTNKEDGHVDHRAAFAAVEKALRRQGLLGLELFQYEITTPLARASHALNITEAIDGKIRLIAQHRTQNAAVDYCSMAKAINLYRANTAGLRNSYLEAYALVKLGEQPGSVEEGLLEERVQKGLLMTEVYDRWLKLHIEGRSIGQYFKKRNCESIAIYGYGKLGKRLLQECTNCGIQVSCMIDKAAEPAGGVPVIKPGRDMPKQDLIVVTAVYAYASVKRELMSYGCEDVVSLEEIICGL